jgi:heptosyltransferase III
MEPQPDLKAVPPDGTIWVVHMGALGDCILTWPAIRCLRRAYPRHRFLGIGKPECMRLAVRFGLLDAFEDGASRGMIGLFSGYGLPEGLDPPDGAVAWTREADGLVRLLKPAATLPVLQADPFPARPEGHMARIHCEAVGREFPIRVPDDLTEDFPEHEPKSHNVLIHPGSGSEKKNFGSIFYENIAYYLRENGHSKIAFLMGPAEIERGWAESFKNQALIFPNDTMALADWLQNAVLYLGNDSGVSHLAGYMGIPSVVLYRSTDPRIWGVLGKYARLVAEEREDAAFERIIGCINDISRGPGPRPSSGGS